MNENQIIELFFERRESAITACSEKYGKTILSLAKGVLGDDGAAEECLDDTLLALWNAIPPERPEHLFAYVLKTARNLSLKRARHDSAKRRHGAVRDIALDELSEISDKFSCLDEILARELASRINSALSEMSDCERAVFVRRYYLYQSVKTISRELGYGESKIKMILSRSRAKLRKMLKKEGYIQ